MASDLPETEKLKSMPSIGQIDEGFKLSPAMEEIVVNFLVESKFITAEGKDPETKALNSRTLDLLQMRWRCGRPFASSLRSSTSFSRWRVKRRDPNVDAHNRSLGAQDYGDEGIGYDFITENIEQAVRLIEPCHGTADSDTHSLLGEVIQTAFECNKDSGRYDDTLQAETGSLDAARKVRRGRDCREECAEHGDCEHVARVSSRLSSADAFDPSTVDEYLSSLMKVLARLHELNTASWRVSFSRVTRSAAKHHRDCRSRVRRRRLLHDQVHQRHLASRHQ